MMKRSRVVSLRLTPSEVDMLKAIAKERGDASVGSVLRWAAGLVTKEFRGNQAEEKGEDSATELNPQRAAL